MAFEALSILGHSLERNTIVKYDFKEKLIVVTIFFTNKEFHNSASYLNDKKLRVQFSCVATNAKSYS